MGIGKVHTSELDLFVKRLDEMEWGSDSFLDLVADFELTWDTYIDENLDPFSEDYWEQQKKLYEEISGRALNQETGELYPIDLDGRISGVNSYGIKDPKFIAKHVRTVNTVIMVAGLKGDDEVLDMGAGSGLSSEVFAYSGLSVTAVDINPECTSLIAARASRLGLPIEAVTCGFDDVDPGKKFDLIFFYECLHHSLRPSDLLARISNYLKPVG